MPPHRGDPLERAALAVGGLEMGRKPFAPGLPQQLRADMVEPADAAQLPARRAGNEGLQLPAQVMGAALLRQRQRGPVSLQLHGGSAVLLRDSDVRLRIAFQWLTDVRCESRF